MIYAGTWSMPVTKLSIAPGRLRSLTCRAHALPLPTAAINLGVVDLPRSLRSESRGTPWPAALVLHPGTDRDCLGRMCERASKTHSEMVSPMTEPEVIVLTGASAGLVRAAAVELARGGTRVALLARGRAGLEGAAGDVERAGGQALVIPTDVADFRSIPARCRPGISRRWPLGASRGRRGIPAVVSCGSDIPRSRRSSGSASRPGSATDSSPGRPMKGR